MQSCFARIGVTVMLIAAGSRHAAGQPAAHGATESDAKVVTLDLTALKSPILFAGDDTKGYRDPSLVYHDGVFHLFFNFTKPVGAGAKTNFGATLQVAVSTSTDLVNWSQMRLLTPEDKRLNFAPVGNVVRFGDEWLLGVCSYPTPNDERVGTKDARGYVMRSKDLVNWSQPELLQLMGPDVPFERMGRILGTWFIEDRDEPGKWWAFYKHLRGDISTSWTRDFKTWTPMGKTGVWGENECVLLVDGWYWLISSPDHGIDFSRSKDLKTWERMWNEKLGRKDWPWVKGRLTAAHVIDLRKVPEVGKLLMVFHGGSVDEHDVRLSLAPNRSIGIAWSDDLEHWEWPGSQASSGATGAAGSTPVSRESSP